MAMTLLYMTYPKIIYAYLPFGQALDCILVQTQGYHDVQQ